MITDDQAAVTAFLRDPASYRLQGPVEVIETHISRIFLVGDRAFKMKRAVKLPYVDFSTPALRVQACVRELELNACTTPELYLQVRRIYRSANGSLSFEPCGEPIDAVVEMRRFEQSCLFDRIAEAGGLNTELMTRTARMIADFHAGAAVVRNEGGAANISAVLDINKAGFATSTVFSGIEQQEIDTAFRTRLSDVAVLLDRRSAEGLVRLCHGDLHLRNLCLINGEPRLFDCIDFNDRIATVDVLYDLAFLVMDLWHRGLHDHANIVANRYADATGEVAGFSLLPFFVALRAAVRAHVTATQAEEAGGNDELALIARSYFDLALHSLQTTPACMITIGGFSGSGKSTVADRLAPALGAAPGARLIESDRVRKALHGVSAETHLGDDAYAPGVSEKVYAAMAAAGETLLRAGSSVVIDAVFDRTDRRVALESACGKAQARFCGVWLDAPPETLRARVGARRGGQSDATVQVLEKQLARGTADVTWSRVDATKPPGTVVAAILALVETGCQAP